LFCVLALRYAWDAGSTPGRRAPALAGVLLALCGLQYWFYGVFVGLAILVHGAARAASPPPGSGGGAAILLRHGVIAGIALGAVAPAAAPLLVETFTAIDGVPGLVDVARWSF